MKKAITAKDYFNKNKEQYEYLDIFFGLCRKYNISYASASEKDKAFIAEAARVTYEVNKAKRDGLPVLTVKPSFDV